jgi:hypothetical protein
MPTEDYRGIVFTIPNSDDGEWRWIVSPSRTHKAIVTEPTPREVYPTREAAVKGAQRAIDRMLDKR